MFIQPMRNFTDSIGHVSVPISDKNEESTENVYEEFKAVAKYTNNTQLKLKYTTNNKNQNRNFTMQVFNGKKGQGVSDFFLGKYGLGTWTEHVE